MSHARTFSDRLGNVSLTVYPERDVTDVPKLTLTRWKKCGQIQELFWKGWSKE